MCQRRNDGGCYHDPFITIDIPEYIPLDESPEETLRLLREALSKFVVKGPSQDKRSHNTR